MRCERPRIAETGVTVQRVVRWYRLGLTPKEIADRIGHLSLAQVHAALSYDHANRQQTDAEVAWNWLCVAVVGAALGEATQR